MDECCVEIHSSLHWKCGNDSVDIFFFFFGWIVRFIRKAMDRWTLSYQLRRKWKHPQPLCPAPLASCESCLVPVRKSAKKCCLPPHPVLPDLTAGAAVSGRCGCWCLAWRAGRAESLTLAESGSRTPAEENVKGTGWGPSSANSRRLRQLCATWKCADGSRWPSEGVPRAGPQSPSRESWPHRAPVWLSVPRGAAMANFVANWIF